MYSNLILLLLLAPASFTLCVSPVIYTSNPFRAAPSPHAARSQKDRPVDSEVIIRGCQLMGQALGAETYAVAGGAAVVLLGSPRKTGDIDISVPRGATLVIKRLISPVPGISITQPERHVFYTEGETKVPVEVVAPGLTDFGFDATTPTVLVDGIKVLHPIMILNTKCLLRRGENDEEDIAFLVRWLVNNGVTVTVDNIPNCRGVRATIPLIGAAGQ